MQVSAIQKLTLLDFPDRTACIVFTPGCNLRCGYCHNPEFVLPESVKALRDSFIEPDAVFGFLKRRIDRLEGVVISGGEPTLQRGLIEFLNEVRAMGFQAKLDTNGSLPEILKPILERQLVDYVAMDVKTSLHRYRELTNACVRPEAIGESIELIKRLAPEYEFRTTILHEHHDERTLEEMKPLISGSKRYVLQGFRPGKTLDASYQSHEQVREADLKRYGSLFKSEAEEILIRY